MELWIKHLGKGLVPTEHIYIICSVLEAKRKLTVHTGAPSYSSNGVVFKYGKLLSIQKF